MKEPEIRKKSLLNYKKYLKEKHSSGYRFCEDYKDQIIDLYCNKKLMIVEIAKIIHFSPTWIGQKLSEWGIKVIHPFTSLAEKEIKQFLQDNGINIICNNRSILDGQELDFYLPDYNIAIEYNGVYYHSELNGKNKFYHLNKTNKCKEKGIRLIHIFEDEWIERHDIIKSRLLNFVGKTPVKIYARNTVCKQITKKQAKYLLDFAHIQGYGPCKIAYGLFYEDQLVSVMTFSNLNISKNSNKKETNNKDNWELVRFANIINCNVVGGASKLLKHFINDIKPKKIISYADVRWSFGNLYKKLGFTLSHTSTPNYWYIINGDYKRRHRFSYRKTKDCPPNLTEWQWRQSQGFDRIWDCGNQCWIMKFK